MCALVCSFVHMFTHVEVTIRRFPQLLPTLVYEAGSLTLELSTWLGWETREAPRGPVVFVSLAGSQL